MQGPKRPFKRRPHGRSGRPFPRKKVCRFCADKIHDVDYKNVTFLRNYLSDRGKILGGKTTGTCAKHQRKLNTAIKRARNIALLPYSVF